MDCYEKHSLRRKYTLYVRAYSEAVGKLLAVTSEATRSDWALAWELINRVHFLCLDTFNQIKQHTGQHGCLDAGEQVIE